ILDLSWFPLYWILDSFLMPTDNTLDVRFILVLINNTLDVEFKL
ncbi:24384_t:CDS:2, partial [Racocetra persica]